jgi:hypothetical protein
VKIEGINDDNRSEISAENNIELWTYLFTAEIEDPTVKTIEIIPAKTLKINNKLTSQQEQKLLDVLKRNIEAFAWDYKDMKGIHPSICTHHIYIKEDCKPVRKPQRRMNPAMKDIVKQELQKLSSSYFTLLRIFLSHGGYTFFPKELCVLQNVLPFSAAYKMHQHLTIFLIFHGFTGWRTRGFIFFPF